LEKYQRNISQKGDSIFPERRNFFFGNMKFETLQTKKLKNYSEITFCFDFEIGSISGEYSSKCCHAFQVFQKTIKIF